MGRSAFRLCECTAQRDTNRQRTAIPGRRSLSKLLRRFIARVQSIAFCRGVGTLNKWRRLSCFPGCGTVKPEIQSKGHNRGNYCGEFAVVDNSGMVHPFTRPLGIREDATYAQTKHPAEALGATSGVKPLPLGAVGICKYRAGASGSRRLFLPDKAHWN